MFDGAPASAPSTERPELVVGAAFAGRLPDGVRVTSKCNLGEIAPDQIEAILRRSIEGSLARLRLSRLDLFAKPITEEQRQTLIQLRRRALQAIEW